MNLFHEAKKVLDKDGKVNALGPYGKQKLTGREVSTYFRRNKVKDAQIKKAVEVALDMGGAMSVAYKEITKFYGKKVADSKEVQNALQYANEETFREGLGELEETVAGKDAIKKQIDQINQKLKVLKPKLAKARAANNVKLGFTLSNQQVDLWRQRGDLEDRLSEGQFWGQKKMAKAHAAQLRKSGAVMLQKKEKGGESRITLPKGHKDIKKYMKQGYKQIPIESVEPEKKNLVDEGRSELDKHIKSVKHISDIEIRFSDEKEWKRMSALVKKELRKPEYKSIKPKDVYYSPDPLQIGFGDPDGKSKTNIKPIVDLIAKQTKDKETRLKSMYESIRRGEPFVGTKDTPGGKGKWRNLTTLRKKKFDALYKKMDGGPEHRAIKKKIKNQVKADDAFHALVMKKVTNEEVVEAFSKTPKSGAEVAKMMMKSKTMKGFANKVKKMKTVTAVQLDKMLPDYVSGGDIGAMFEEITEGKLGDSIIRKDFPNVWAASAKDRTILKKFHAKVNTSNYKKQKELYNKNKKSFMSGLGKEKLSSIMKKMTIKKGPMKGWMTDDVVKESAKLLGYELEEAPLTGYGASSTARDSNKDARVAAAQKNRASEGKVEALQRKLEHARKQRDRHDEAAMDYRDKAEAIRERNPNDTSGADGYENRADRQEDMAMRQNDRVQDIKDQIRKAKGIKDSYSPTGENLEEINMNMPEKVRVQLLTLYNKAMDVPHGSPAFKGIKKQIDKINQKYAIKEDSAADIARKSAEMIRKTQAKQRINKINIDIQKTKAALAKAREAGSPQVDSLSDKYQQLRKRRDSIEDSLYEVKSFFDTYRDMQIQEKKELDPATIGSIAAMTDNNDHNKALITLAKAMKEMKVVKMLELLSQMHKVEGSMSSDMVAIRKGMYQELMKKSKRVFSNHKEIYKAF